MSKLGADPFPKYPPAGFKRDTLDQSSAVCLQPPNRPPPTPEEIARYRKSFKEQAGVTIQHYGIVKDPLPPAYFIYGQPTEKSEAAGDIMTAGHKPGVTGFINDLKESKYASQQKEPVGKSLSRDYKLPEVCADQNFKYGKPTDANQYSAKDTICPNEYLSEQEEVKKMYLKSHGSYEPGQQKDREFKWNVDPTDFRFGKVEKNPVHKEIVQIMHPEAQDNTFVETKFVKANYKDFVNLKEDKLGKPRNLGQNKDLPPDFVFGVRYEPNEWDAGKCIKGQATHKDVETQPDIGKATRPGFRNTVKEGDETRVFGVPTIRTDIKKPTNSSIADPNVRFALMQNYGDENRAVQLVFPQNYSELGVNEQDFAKRYDKKTIRQIFERVGFVYKQGKFQAMFARAKQYENTILDAVSCRAFLRAVHELDHVH